LLADLFVAYSDDNVDDDDDVLSFNVHLKAG